MILDRLLEQRATLEQARTTLKDPGDWMIDWFGGAESATGKRVTETMAMTNMGVFACVRIKAETIAWLPLKVYERLQPSGKRPAPEHPLYRIVHDEPNEFMTAFSMREAMQGHLDLWGNNYARIEIDGGGGAIGMFPFRPDRVRPFRKNGSLRYEIRFDDGVEILPDEEMIHVPGLGWDGLVGFSPIRMAMEAVGFAMGLEEFGARYIGQGFAPSGIFTHPGKLGDKAYLRLKKDLAAKHQRLEDKHRALILEEGLGWQQVGIKPDEAQFLATRKFQLAEIARLFRMQLSKLQDLDRQTHSNIEQQAIEHVLDTIAPSARRWEQEFNRKLLSADDRGKFFVEFNFDALMRGDSKARSEFYNQMFMIGAYSINDILEIENRNRVEGGDRRFVPLNMVPLDQVDDLEPESDSRARLPAGPGRSVEIRRRVQRTHVRLLSDAAARVLRKEISAVRRAITKHLEARDVAGLRAWIETFYRDRPADVTRTFLPALEVLADQIQTAAAEELGSQQEIDLGALVRSYAEHLGSRHAISSQAHLVATLVASDLARAAGALEQVLSEWEGGGTAVIASREATQAGAAFAQATWAALGVRSKRWVTIDDSPLCRALSGKVVPIGSTFLSEGDSLEPEGGGEPLIATRAIGHPPLYPGCDCMLAPVK